MNQIILCMFNIFVFRNVFGSDYVNNTLDNASRQLLAFKLKHPLPIGILTTSAGKAVDLREIVTINTDVFNNAFYYDLQSSMDHERIPERINHAKGTGAFGYFEVTHDVSKYTKADVFNGVGKKTPLVARLSVLAQNIGGSDVVRETNAMAVKFYTNEGNLDFLTLNIPVYFYRDPNDFSSGLHAVKRNPKTNLFGFTTRLEFFTMAPNSIHAFLWLVSDFGIPYGYRNIDVFPIHTYELNNKYGDRYFVRFNFRTEQGVKLLTSAAATILRSRDPDYAVRDLYDAISTGNFPAWRLEMDVIPKNKLTKLNYNPFELNRMWDNGTYNTVTIGRLVLNKNPENFFKDVKQAAFNPGNLVPGIPGPRDNMFKARRFAYRDAQNHRLGPNHNKIEVNRPINSNLYNRDGIPPVLNNMKDGPNYYQNSFNGPVPYINAARPKASMSIYDRNAVDLQSPADFYNNFVTTEGQRDRMASNIAEILLTTADLIQKRTLRLLFLVDRDLGTRTAQALAAARAELPMQLPVFTLVEHNPKTLDVT